jgi:hypothetical protein
VWHYPYTFCPFLVGAKYHVSFKCRTFAKIRNIDFRLVFLVLQQTLKEIFKYKTNLCCVYSTIFVFSENICRTINVAIAASKSSMLAETKIFIARNLAKFRTFENFLKVFNRSVYHGMAKVHSILYNSVHHKVHIYKEYHSECPLVGIGTLPTPLASECAPPPRTGEEGLEGRLACGWGVGGDPIPTTGEKA